MVQEAGGSISQIGFVVADLDAAVASRIRHLGLGPWTIFRNVSLEGRYRGESTHVTMDVALAYQGDIQIELIQPTGGGASPYRDAAGTPITGMHHMAWVVDDLNAAVTEAVAHGLRPVFEASNPSTQVAYMEAADEPGTLYEYIESAGMHEMIAAGIAAARAWDGADPVQIIDLKQG